MACNDTDIWKTHLNKAEQIINLDFYLRLQNTENSALNAPSFWSVLPFYTPLKTPESQRSRGTSSFQLQVCLSMYDLLVDIRVTGLTVYIVLCPCRLVFFLRIMFSGGNIIGFILIVPNTHKQKAEILRALNKSVF